ncbi:transposase InsO family protein [Arthrobacter cupressi]|nr:DDE-type integrase/transposase/recombinase [Arthrobacter cupressi]NYD77942.1 transposase InsO family protein [Arthrobacter cupressi]
MSQDIVDDPFMSRIPDRVRQQVVEWPLDAPRGAVEEFCQRHGVSRSWFHGVRAKVALSGDQASVKATTRPHHSPARMPESVHATVIATRRRLSSEGKDHGPLSILDVMTRSGFAPLPSRATIARILAREQLTERNKRKRPKQSHQRIRSQYPNQRWQSDGLEVALADGQKVTIVETLDDCTRYNITLHAGASESSAVVTEAFRRAIRAYGRPVLVHTDNGSAFNRERYGSTTALQAFLNDLGVKMITGRPGHPRSQGKVERAHQTLQRFVNARQPGTVQDLERILQEYRDWYNCHRSHQALPPRTTPAQLYETLPKIAPPAEPIIPKRPRLPAEKPDGRREPFGTVIQRRSANRNGRFSYLKTAFTLGKAWEGQTVTILRHDEHLEIFDAEGTMITTTPWPAAQLHVGLARQVKARKQPTQVSTMS